MLKKSLSMTIAIATLLGVLWQNQGAIQASGREIACSEKILNTVAGRKRQTQVATLTTKWNNGRTYREKVFFTAGTNGVYLNWENSEDKFLININGSAFSLRRGNNWQVYQGTCKKWSGFTEDNLSWSNNGIEGSAYSYPDQVAGTFYLGF
ncbi:hypothetical protein H6F92_07880 [Microcystis wesenbergii FACHB-1317]|jgi:hypothetical protein|uniref:hypothetical protein n=2 Tax=Microcystis TaxID=1125 RepID=UPI000E3957E1|nr:hypothetical protein [Microcystis aeruginosa]MBD2288733.1 hypothetical protein [Microcystis wesenbergii FACHB-1317]REJ51707.1 MAG: hypothetical protein DWQ58_13005 [Microcystis aeruginosa TA09]UZO76197.1 hypothetical protein M8120_26540 [Microcystis aeruginosa str. Chao 1910]